jgi:hypothetical protein
MIMDQAVRKTFLNREMKKIRQIFHPGILEEVDRLLDADVAGDDMVGFNPNPHCLGI